MQAGRPSDLLGASFAGALATKDVGALKRILHPDVTFRGLTPARMWEGKGFDAAIEILFDNWFEDDDRIRELSSVRTGRLEDRGRVEYRVRVQSGGREYTVEQVAFFDDDSAQITWMSVLCSGYCPLESTPET